MEHGGIQSRGLANVAQLLHKALFLIGVINVGALNQKASTLNLVASRTKSHILGILGHTGAQVGLEAKKVN